MADPIKYYTIIDSNIHFSGQLYSSRKRFDEVENVLESSTMLDIAAFSSEDKNVNFTAGFLLQYSKTYAIKTVFQHLINKQLGRCAKYKGNSSEMAFHFMNEFVFLTLEETIKYLSWHSIFIAEVQPIDIQNTGPIGQCGKLKILNIEKISDMPMWKDSAFVAHALRINPKCIAFVDSTH